MGASVCVSVFVRLSVCSICTCLPVFVCVRASEWALLRACVRVCVCLCARLRVRTDQVQEN